jgi:hypothetical protein
MGRFTHAALSFKFVSRRDVPRCCLDDCSVKRTEMYDRHQSGGDDLDATSRFDCRGSSQCGVEQPQVECEVPLSTEAVGDPLACAPSDDVICDSQLLTHQLYG